MRRILYIGALVGAALTLAAPAALARAQHYSPHYLCHILIQNQGPNSVGSTTVLRWLGPWHAQQAINDYPGTWCEGFPGATSSSQTAGGFLSYGTPGYYSYETADEGALLMKRGYTLPFCSTTLNPWGGATVVSDGVTYYYWGVPPDGQKPTKVLIGGAGEQYDGDDATTVAQQPGGCWQIA